jgi:hypothetical protein
MGTRWRWVVSVTPRPHYPRERVPGMHWIGGWLGPRASLDVVAKNKTPGPARNRTPVVLPVAWWQYSVYLVDQWRANRNCLVRHSLFISRTPPPRPMIRLATATHKVHLATALYHVCKTLLQFLGVPWGSFYVTCWSARSSPRNCFNLL